METNTQLSHKVVVGLSKMMDRNVLHTVIVQEMVSDAKWLTKPPRAGFPSHPTLQKECILIVQLLAY